MTTTTTAPIDPDPRGPGRDHHLRRPPQRGSTEPPLFLLGSPMAASGFGTLASHFPDRTVITYDPRGAERSTKADPASESTPQQHADDIHRVIEAVGLGPVDLFASSGGAVNALALVAAHPEDVRTLVAHEPPLASVLPDAENAKAAVRAIARSYRDGGFGKGMAHFIAVVGYQGEFPDGFGDQPGPDPAMFGLPADDDGSRTDVLLAQNIITCTTLRARLRRPARRLDAHRARRRRRIGGHDGQPRGARRGRAAGHAARRLPEQPRRVPGRRVRPERPAGRLRGEAPRGARRGLNRQSAVSRAVGASVPAAHPCVSAVFPGDGQATGSATMNRDPPNPLRSIQTRPPIASISRRAANSPIPDPRDRARSTRT